MPFGLASRKPVVAAVWTIVRHVAMYPHMEIIITVGLSLAMETIVTLTVQTIRMHLGKYLHIISPLRPKYIFLSVVPQVVQVIACIDQQIMNA